MIERPVFNYDNQGEPLAPVTPDAGREVVPASPNKGTSVVRPDWPLPAESQTGNVDGQSVVDAVERKWNSEGGRVPAPAADSTAVAAIVREQLERSPDGYDAALGVLQQSASNVLGEVKDAQAFTTAFDQLSSGLQAKALLVLQDRPHARLPELLDRWSQRWI
jgi:hypothetical protein